MPWVVKIGGSLYGSSHLKEWLDILDACSTHQFVIVPGGGPYADQVRTTDRQFGLDMTLAHNMAVLGMQQFGYMLASLCPRMCLASCRERIQSCWDDGKVAIWEPYHMVSQHCELARTWDVTSDSLAAWLARYLSIEHLLFVKSAPVTLLNVSIHDLKKHECIDPVLPTLLADKGITAHFMHKSHANEFAKLIGIT
ncbi:MAG: hypothetical protein OXC41_03140 [Gammaproteobacteria bacterium]|nr:hypothetical protein [Gammaproteobacteria bacterium]